jgi:S-DNA-T family DNA segregation ATPase FtsK/SpoIIIE
MAARKKSERDSGGELPPPSAMRRAGWIILFGLWLLMAASFLSFNPGDPPSHIVAPWNDPIANWCGPVGAFIAYHGYFVIGMGIWLLLAGWLAWLIITATGRVVTQMVIRSIGFVLMALALSAMHGQIAPQVGPLPSSAGGLIAVWAVTELSGRFSGLGTFLCLLGAFSVGAIVAIDWVVFALPRWTWAGVRATRKVRDLPLPSISVPKLSIPGFGGVSTGATLVRPTGISPSTRSSRRNGNGQIDPNAGGIGATQSFVPDEHVVDDSVDQPGLIDPAVAEQPAPRRKLSKDELREKMSKLPVRMAGKIQHVAQDEDIPREENYDGYQFPQLSLLEDPETNFTERMEKFVREQAQILEESLQTYGIDGDVVGIDSGPVVTLYQVELAPGTKVSKVSAVAADLARSLRAQNIRIVPNLTGKTAIGIEVPNLQKEKVRLKELMSGGHAEKMALPMFLGKDASGEPLVADLARMPHMLIAGTTGSGKSVCMNSIIMSWLYTKRPDELKLVLVDPKMVELSQFQNIPHLMCPVVTETGRAAGVLEWAVTKMEERYELLAEATVRDVAAYNALTEEELYERFQPQNDVERAKIPKCLPYMVFIIDELADLILTHKEVEHSIVRIAQKARAVGIHLILATQRPQANVVTGLIKSNMPCRVAFKVSSGMDSRIVLDQKGAELLLGQGDMLFLTPHSSEVRRAQGTLVSDPEIRKVAKFLKDVAAPSFERSLLAIKTSGADAEEGEGGLAPDERDPLFDDAVKIMIESGRGSVSLLQRRLAIGYSRASRLVDQMGLAGILGEHRGSVARDVMITLEEWEEMKRLEEETQREGTLFEGKAGAKTADPGVRNAPADFDLDLDDDEVDENADTGEFIADNDETADFAASFDDEDERQDLRAA